VDWNRWQGSLAKVAEGRSQLQVLGDDLSQALACELEGIKPGHEDPVLVRLLGPELTELLRKVGWSTLVLNPGSTSTKVAVYNGLTLLAEGNIPQDPEQVDGLDSRVALVRAWLDEQGLSLLELTGIAARGGLMAPVTSGTYAVCEAMLKDLSASAFEHASNLAAPMAVKLGALAGPDILLTTSDPVVCDEVDLVHRITGSAKVLNDGRAVHYLNHRAVAELSAALLGQSRDRLHMITCHMGGGMSAVRHLDGRMPEVLQGFGTLPSANRSGALPLHELIRLMETRQYSLDDLRRDVMSEGGLLALAGTQDFKALFEFAAHGASEAQQEKIELLVEFFASRVASGIQELAAHPRPVDCVVLTGGLAHDQDFCRRIIERLQLPVPVARLPGSLEHTALVAGLLKLAADKSGHRPYAEVRDEQAVLREQEQTLLGRTIFEPAPVSERMGSPNRLEEIVGAACAGDSPTIALVGADNDEALLAVKQANEQAGGPMARFLLLGPHEEISQLAWELDVPIDGENVILVDTDDPVERARELMLAGLADTLMKGNATTAQVLKGYLGYLKAASQRGNKSGGKTLLSHIGLFEIPGRSKLVLVSDAAMNTYPDVETRMGILENSIQAMRLLGYAKPKVAVISAVEKPSKAVISSMEGRAIAEAYAARDDLIVEGPLSVDLALSPESAVEKRYTGRIQGDADLLLVPDIDAGNAIYKAFTITSGATLAGVILGGATPLILTSRGDSSRSKLSSIALAVLLTNRNKERCP